MEPLTRRAVPHRDRRVAAWCDDLTVRVAARAGVTPRSVVGLAVVLVVVASVLGVRAVQAGRHGHAVPLAPAASQAVPSRADGPDAAPAPATALANGPATPTTGPPRIVVVDVVGMVRHPRVVELPVGARVRDAVRAAGGVRHGGDLAAVNLARVLADGEQVAVPGPGQPLPAGVVGARTPTSPGTGGAGPPVSLNTATEEQLDALPGVGPVLAGRILDWRTQHGRFSSIDELGEVSGIGDRVLERLRAQVTL